MNLRLKTLALCFPLLINMSCQRNIKAFKNSTIANEPTLKLNSQLIISKSESPDYNDFIAYNFQSKLNGAEIRIHKLVAKENDTIKIIDGIVYINSVNIDKGKNLMHFYKIPKVQYLTIKKKENIGNQFYTFPFGKDSVNAMLEDNIAKKYNLQAQRQIKKFGVADNFIKEIFKKDWNEDNFGPYTIPKNKFFVIGENRNNSEDSRYIGVIDISQIVGVIIN